MTQTPNPTPAASSIVRTPRAIDPKNPPAPATPHLASVAPAIPVDDGMQYADNQPSYPTLQSPAVPELAAQTPALPLQSDVSGDSVQSLLAAELRLGFVPKTPLSVDAIRVIRYVQIKGAIHCDSREFSELAETCIREVADQLGWDILPTESPDILRITDFNDFQMSEW